MGVMWHLSELLDQRGLVVADLGAPIGPDWLTPTPPEGLGMAELARLCERLGCQPGELLTYEAEDPAAQAARNLAGDLFYQSFLAHRAMDEDDDQTG